MNIVLSATATALHSISRAQSGKQRVQQIRVKKSFSFIEARKLDIAEQSSTQVSLTSVVSSAQVRSARPVSHRDMEVQTDLN